MRIRHVRLHNFRNLSSQTISFPKRVTLVVGENGQGKTSLLEALFFCATARSFRSSKSREIIRWGEKEATVSCELDSLDGRKELRCHLAEGKRSILVNGNPVQNASAYYGQLRCICFTPESIQLVQGAPGGRRRFIDQSQSIIAPGFVDTLVQYQRALKQRNALLLQMKRESASIQSVRSSSQLAVWEELLLKFGCEIVKRRTQFISSLEPLLIEFYKQLSANREVPSMRYESGLIEEGQDTETLFQKGLLERRMSDFQRGQTSTGPHRDEVGLYLDYGDGAKSARSSASQGQSRTFALALTLAVMQRIYQETDEAPLVLLDDIESELDASRRRALFGLLASYDAQTIITATEPSEEEFLEEKSVHCMLLRDGEIAEYF